MILVKLCKALGRSYLDYCVQAWRPHLRKDIELLEKVQRRTTRLIDVCKGKEYEDRLRMVRLTSLEKRMQRADMLEVFKITRGTEGSETFF